MPRSKPNPDFEIHVDPSCLSAPMDEETQPHTTEQNENTDAHIRVDDTASVEGAASPETTSTLPEAPSAAPENLEAAEANPKHDEEETGAEHLEESELEQDPSAVGMEGKSSTIETDIAAADKSDHDHESHVHPSIEEDILDTAQEGESPRGLSSPRRTSKRTEAMIRAAARDILEHIDDHKNDKAGDNDEETGDISVLSERTGESYDPHDAEHSYTEQSESGDGDDASHISHNPTADAGGDSSSQHEVTDDETFSDKSPRSSLGSYDGGSESGKRIDADNMTTVTRSPRISDISQYDKEDFVPTARGTPRPPFRTPSDVRAMQMSSPTPSLIGSPRSPRSTKRHFPTVSRLGTPTASTQYSPKGKSTPPRFKTKQEAPLVLLHVTLLPLRWMWGDLVNNLDPTEMSEQAKTLRDAWQMLQDRVGDTVIERGILLGHPQNDYEVLEERLLEALELPVRRRARILECGHYLGPSNEITMGEEEESEDEYGQERRQSAYKRHWCGTCKNEIQYDALGTSKIFRVKVYASNGLMRAGAWAACWKEMERVDAELEPIVDPAVQNEIVRLAASQRERELSHREEAEIVKEVEKQFEEELKNEQAGLLHAQDEVPTNHLEPEPALEPTPEPTPEPIPEPTRPSRSARRRQRDEERLREIYEDTPPPPETHAEAPPSHEHRHPDSYIPPPSPRSPSQDAYERREAKRQNYQGASLPQLLLEALRVLVQDRKNVAIIALSVFVLMLALRSAPSQQSYEPIISGIKDVPKMHQAPILETPQPVAQQQSQLPNVESKVEVQNHQEYSESQQSATEVESVYSAPGHGRVADSVSQPIPVQDAATAAQSVSTVYGPCETPMASQQTTASQVASEVPYSEETETVTQKKVVRVVQTVTETEAETETAVETVTVKATPIPESATPSVVEEMVADENVEGGEELMDELVDEQTALSEEVDDQAGVSDEVDGFLTFNMGSEAEAMPEDVGEEV
ncbi:Uu.00g076870.m01.CDS01 [Anthostomella pinea]|uniref:Uu.00g076870.m01.CDS01 n=1 Tax=Anthostomella pinea TaxID=933095 RepID=A0AAI8YLW0_9PEZI|nr:Uu.00g076870.m01.CDS01 [Anthostomella pinea]